MNHLPVVYNEKLVGMISIRDVLETYYKHLGDPSSFTIENIDSHFKVEDIMTKDVHSIKADATREDAAKTFKKNMFRSLPVTNNEGQLIGIITPLDLI
jgi:CBS domain-containing protein